MNPKFRGKCALLAVVVLVVPGAGCGDESPRAGSDDGGAAGDGSTGDLSGGSAGDLSGGSEVDPSIFNCAEVPTAYVFDHVDPWTGVMGAAGLLTQAGFDVQPLPLDRDPAELQGLIFFASFASESADYRKYAKDNATRLFTFVDKGNVLLQMTQADQTEAIPPFLPTTQTARRHDTDLGRLHVLSPSSPLLAGVSITDQALTWSGAQLGWETFVEQGGFEVMLAEDGSGKNAALMEGAYGQGRIILTGTAFDKPLGSAAGPVPFGVPVGDPAQRDQFNSTFFANLYKHVRNVCRRQTAALNVTTGPRLMPQEGSFMLAVLPDTQVYSLLLPGIFSAQTGWIAANAAALHIPYVLHLGDIVNNNTEDEWRRAEQSMSLLDGVVPYALVPGNHDYGPAGSASTRDTLMNQYFSFTKQQAWPTFGGAYETGKLDNSYHLFSAGGRDYIVIALEWAPRDQVVAWANEIMAQHPAREGILITHAYLNYNDRRYDYTDAVNPQDFNPHHYGTPGGPVNDGEQLWQKLVRRHRFVFVLAGHVLGDGAGYLASVTDKGNTCHQILSNYQFRTLGGEGYMRLMEFLKDGRTVRVATYSPLYDGLLLEADQNFTVTLDPPPP